MGAVRITNNLTLMRSLGTVRKGLSDVAAAQESVTSGQRINRPSDDPTGAARVLATDSDLRALTQYGRNIGTARQRLTVEETALDQVSGIMERARELAYGQAGATANAQTRTVTAEEIDELFKQVVQIANTQEGDTYVFGGMYPDRAPLDATTGAEDPAAPTRQAASYEVGAGSVMEGAHGAGTLFIDTDVLDSLEALATALRADDTAGIEAAGDRIAASHSNLQGIVGEVGARQIRLDVAEANVESLDLNLRNLRSDLMDVEMEEAITVLVNRQASYQAALLSTSRLLDTTLTNYLR
ncbi:flagellar hook-associated protein FlgL [Gemmatimonadota bacterium Y43]|uniref:flagellar hook-associated protein FlgL n=1 Tax=Gaopeijia maritima TaxID=3119007 RepID=UPI0032866FA3